MNLKVEACKYAGLKPSTDLDDSEENYYNTIAVEKASAFIAGAASKSVQIARLRYAILQLNRFRDSAFGKGKNIIAELETELEFLKNE